MRRIIVAGSRSFDDYFTLRRILDGHLCGRGDVAIISGHARGVDLMGEAYAKRMGIPCEVYPADWKRWQMSWSPSGMGSLVARQP